MILQAMTDTVREVELGEGPGKQEQIPGMESDSGVTLWEGSFSFPHPHLPRC